MLYVQLHHRRDTNYWRIDEIARLGKFSILTKFLPQIRFLPFRVLGGRSVITQIGFFVFVLIVVVAVVVIIVIRRAGGLVLWFVVLPV